MKKPPNTLFNTLQLLPWCLQMYFYLIFEYGGIALPQRVKQIHAIMVNVSFMVELLLTALAGLQLL